jgi:hypothetical protein
MLISHLGVAPRIRTRRAIPPLPHSSSCRSAQLSGGTTWYECFTCTNRTVLLLLIAETLVSCCTQRTPTIELHVTTRREDLQHLWQFWSACCRNATVQAREHFQCTNTWVIESSETGEQKAETEPRGCFISENVGLITALLPFSLFSDNISTARPRPL